MFVGRRYGPFATQHCRSSKKNKSWITPKPSRKEFMQSQLVFKKVVEEKDKENLL